MLGNIGAFFSRAAMVGYSALKAEASYSSQVENKISNIFSDIIPLVWIVVTVALIGVGVALIATNGSPQAHEAVKSKVTGIIIGCIIVLGAVHIAKYLCEMFKF